MTKQVPTRIANILINALKGGVVPRAGLEYITVGRTQEIAAILHDIDMIEEGGASFRFIVGKYGSGKSFLLQTIRNYATAKGFAVVDADLSPERRFAGTKGQGLATYKELIKNLSTGRRRASADIGEMDFRHPDVGQNAASCGRKCPEPGKVSRRRHGGGGFFGRIRQRGGAADLCRGRFPGGNGERFRVRQSGGSLLESLQGG